MRIHQPERRVAKRALIANSFYPQRATIFPHDLWTSLNIYEGGGLLGPPVERSRGTLPTKKETVKGHLAKETLYVGG